VPEYVYVSHYDSLAFHAFHKADIKSVIACPLVLAVQFLRNDQRDIEECICVNCFARYLADRKMWLLGISPASFNTCLSGLACRLDAPEDEFFDRDTLDTMVGFQPLE